MVGHTGSYMPVTVPNKAGKMFWWIILPVFNVFVHLVQSDVSHLVFGTVDPFYGFHPVFISSTPRPALPEIIVNSAKTGGYHYERPDNVYLPPPTPPPQADPPIIGYLPPAQSIPLADPPPAPPNPTYLPPHQHEHISENLEGVYPQNDIIVINNPTPANGHKDNDFGYHYDPPTTTTTTPAPIFADHPETPGGYVYETPKTPTSGYLPPTTEQRLAKGFGTYSEEESNSIQLQLHDMRCVPNQGGFFRTVLSLQSAIYTAPIVDNDIIDGRCDLRVVRSQIHVNIAAEDFQRCGVSYCGANLCLRIRFPLIHGMRTSGDSILTLQCKTQDRVVSKTHAVKVGVSNEFQARSVGALAQGGSQQPFRTHLELLRKTSNGFTKYLEPNGIVQLGEDLQLRAHARAGDGWNFTRLADVNLQRVSATGEIINSAALVNPSGCINPSMRSICPVPPIFEPPLGHRLTFKAAMFQGMRSGDGLLMSVKIVGCMDQRDCYVNNLGCDRSALNSARIRRNIDHQSKSADEEKSNATELSEISTIAFRVQMPDVEPVISEAHHINVAHVVIGGVLGVICLICFLAVLVYLRFSRKY